MLVLDHKWQCFLIPDMFISARSHHASLCLMGLVRIVSHDLPACFPNGFHFSLVFLCSPYSSLFASKHSTSSAFTPPSSCVTLWQTSSSSWFTSSWSLLQQLSNRSHSGFHECQQLLNSVLLYLSMFSFMFSSLIHLCSFSFFLGVECHRTQSTFTSHFWLVIHTSIY